MAGRPTESAPVQTEMQRVDDRATNMGAKGRIRSALPVLSSLVPILLVGLSLALVVGGGRPALAAPTARNVSTYTGYGFDTCSAPS
ncbi:MAG: hypothetical protein ACXVZ1_04050, partial [Gaiellaceae bacterium]